MDFEFKNVLQAVGGNASLVFASWIFMTFVQARYIAAYERYRRLIDAYRDAEHGKRRDVIRDEIMVYYKRVNTMRHATDLGLYAAMLLIATLIVGALDVVFGAHTVFKIIGTVCALAGLVGVIWSASLVVLENRMIARAISGELGDIPELADQAGQPRA
jgi:uncharacterized membrane protein